MSELDTPFCVDWEAVVAVSAVAPPIPELLVLVLVSVAELEDTVAELLTDPAAGPTTVALDPAVETAAVVELAPSLVTVAAESGPELGAASGSPQPKGRTALAMNALSA